MKKGIYNNRNNYINNIILIIGISATINATKIKKENYSGNGSEHSYILNL